ncbi:MAG: Crp/Fnr family transcriptional regulator [Williamsia sp.]|nr:Crp/Fnr family transcriptional regulator [Williamsia sp.]
MTPHQQQDDAQKNYLKRVHQYFNLFMPFTEEDLQLLVPYIEIRTFQKKQLVLNRGEVDNYFNIIMKGLVRKYIIVGKNDVTLQISGEGHIIHSEISFHTQTPSESLVETIEPTILFSLSYDNLQKVFELYPKMERLGRMIVTRMFIKKDHRDFYQLKSTTRERFMNYVEKHADMLQRVPQKYIASYLNIKPETFSRLKHLLKNKKSQ